MIDEKEKEGQLCRECAGYVVHNICMDCDEYNGPEECEFCTGTKKIRENIGQRDERVYPCPFCCPPVEEGDFTGVTNEDR